MNNNYKDKESWMLPIAITIAVGFFIWFCSLLQSCSSKVQTPWQPNKNVSHKRYKR
jgi:hypothetical protein